MKKSLFIIISLITATGLKVEFIFNKNFLIRRNVKNDHLTGDTTSVYDLRNDLIFIIDNNLNILSREKFDFKDFGSWNTGSKIKSADLINDDPVNGKSCKLFRIIFKNDLSDTTREEFNLYCTIPELNHFLKSPKYKKLLTPLNPVINEDLENYLLFESYSYSPQGTKLTLLKIDQVRIDTFDIKNLTGIDEK